MNGSDRPGVPRVPAAAPERPVDPGGGLSIQAVSTLLQVPAPTIRSWERRYGIATASRSTGGHRRFFPADVTVLRRMRDEIARGRRAADAAARARTDGEPESAYQPMIDDFLSAAHDLDSRRLSAVLDRARDRLGVDQAVCGVLMPSMRQVGLWWQTGRCDVANEHLATETVRGWLNRLLYLGPAPSEPEVVVLACGPRDFHTIGLEGLGVLLGQRGWGCRVLGARTPVRSLVTAIDLTDAAAVVLVSHLAVVRRPAVEALRAAETTRALVFYAGSSFISPLARQRVPGTYLGEDLGEAVDTVTSSLVARRPPP